MKFRKTMGNVQWGTLNNLQLQGMEDYNLDTILASPRVLVHEENTHLWTMIKWTVKLALFTRYRLGVGGDEQGSLLFFWSSDYECSPRYRILFDAVRKTADKYILVEPYKNKTPDINSVIKVLKILSWRRKIKNALSCTKREATYYALNLIRADIMRDKYIRCTRGINYKYVVTFCDVHPVDAIITQYAKRIGKHTITLQHGHFNAKDSGWVFSKSKSDYFLLHGKYAKEEAVLSGHGEEGLIPLGMMNFIGVKREEVVIDTEKKVFALILNGPAGEIDNREMIRCANEFAEKLGLKIIIRTHPAISIERYDNDINSKLTIRVSDKSETISQLLSEVQFVLVGNSTVFIEALYLGKLTFRFVGRGNDIYDRIMWCAVHNCDEICEKYLNEMKSVDDVKNKIRNTTEYLCKSGDIRENYHRFFANLCKEL